jgi:Domain of unknown function (DUF4136)
MRQVMHFRRIVLAIAAVGCYMACAQEVLGNFLLGTDFSKYHTYRWISVEGGTHPNQVADAQIKQSVDSQLASKGLTKTDSESADVYVGYQIAVDQKKPWKRYGGYGTSPWDGMAAATSPTLDLGTLVLDMYDPRTKRLVWTETATKSLEPSSNQEESMKNLDQTIGKLFKNYPPR